METKKIAEIATFVLCTIDVKPNTVTTEMKGCYIMVKGSVK